MSVYCCYGSLIHNNFYCCYGSLIQHNVYCFTVHWFITMSIVSRFIDSSQWSDCSHFGHDPWCLRFRSLKLVVDGWFRIRFLWGMGVVFEIFLLSDQAKWAFQPCSDVLYEQSSYNFLPLKLWFLNSSYNFWYLLWFSAWLNNV